MSLLFIQKILDMNFSFNKYKGLPPWSLGSRLVLFWNLRNEEEFCKLFYVVQESSIRSKGRIKPGWIDSLSKIINRVEQKKDKSRTKIDRRETLNIYNDYMVLFVSERIILTIFLVMTCSVKVLFSYKLMKICHSVP